MALSEFELIQTYFNRNNRPQDADILLGIGDDCAILRPRPGQDLLVSIDTLIEGVHFPQNTKPYQLGWRCLAVNLSDLAAMGAEPTWFTLALTLPDNDDSWISEFSRGLFELADRHHIRLIGGDTTRGALSITIQVHGYTPAGKALRRDGAQADDAIYVTGFPGEAGAGLHRIRQGGYGDTDHLIRRFYQPQPRLAFGQAIRELAHSAIDISDGLLADLGHILQRSDKGACVEMAAIPCSTQLVAAQGEVQALSLALTAGDDYELCFSAAAKNHAQVMQLAQAHQLPVTRIGTIIHGSELNLIDASGNPVVVENRGYQHFQGQTHGRSHGI